MQEHCSDVFSLHCRDLPVDPRTLLGSVDIRETDKDYQFVVDVPGLTKDDVKVRVSGDNILTIEGERKVRPPSSFTCLSFWQSQESEQNDYAAAYACIPKGQCCMCV